MQLRSTARACAARTPVGRPSAGRADGSIRQPGAYPAPDPGVPFLGGKGTKRPPGEGPRSPGHRPEGDTPFLILLALCCSWSNSADGAYPSPAALLRLPTGPIGRSCCGTSVRCASRVIVPAAQRRLGRRKRRLAAIRRAPAAGSAPLRGRQVCSGLRPLATLSRLWRPTGGVGQVPVH